MMSIVACSHLEEATSSQPLCTTPVVSRKNNNKRRRRKAGKSVDPSLLGTPTTPTTPTTPVTPSTDPTPCHKKPCIKYTPVQNKSWSRVHQNTMVSTPEEPEVRHDVVSHSPIELSTIQDDSIHLTPKKDEPCLVEQETGFLSPNMKVLTSPNPFTPRSIRRNTIKTEELTVQLFESDDEEEEVDLEDEEDSTKVQSVVPEAPIPEVRRRKMRTTVVMEDEEVTANTVDKEVTHECKSIGDDEANKENFADPNNFGDELIQETKIVSRKSRSNRRQRRN